MNQQTILTSFDRITFTRGWDLKRWLERAEISAIWKSILVRIDG